MLLLHRLLLLLLRSIRDPVVFGRSNLGLPLDFHRGREVLGHARSGRPRPARSASAPEHVVAEVEFSGDHTAASATPEFDRQMNGAQLPILYLPLVWVGVIGTSLTYAALARAHFDLSRVLTSLHIRNEFTFAVCLYGTWTLAVALLLSYLLARHGITPVAVGLKGGLSLAGAMLAVGGAVLGIALWPIAERIARLVGGSPFPMRRLDRQRSNRLGPWEFVLLTTFGAIVVPALEEFVFRGYVLTALQKHASSPASAILLTSVIFASIHFVLGRGAVVYAFFSSLMLSALFLFSGNLYPAILMHSLVNFFGFVAGPMLFHSQSPRSTQEKADS